MSLPVLLYLSTHAALARALRVAPKTQRAALRTTTAEALWTGRGTTEQLRTLHAFCTNRSAKSVRELQHWLDWIARNPRERSYYINRPEAPREQHHYINRTPLHVAAYNGAAEQVRRLLAAGADAGAQCKRYAAQREGNTPLMQAAGHGHTLCVYLLARARVRGRRYG